MSYGVKLEEYWRRSVPYTTEDLAGFGKTLVIAPHPDDESLGCGGTIAMLRNAFVNVEVIFISDGSMSHPNSVTYPQERLAAFRRQEATRALIILGVTAGDIYFMALKDGQVPYPGNDGFGPAASQLNELMNNSQPNTVIMPWRRDPHPDHRASWYLTTTAILRLGSMPRMIEYPIWLWERGVDDDWPLDREVLIRRVMVSTEMDRKSLAIQAHQSQVTRLIDDDPQGFWLSPEVIGHFQSPVEIFFEPKKQ